MVKRYDYVVRSGLGTFAVDMEATKDGEYVTHDDYAALAERCERLEAALRSALKTAEFEQHPFRAWHDDARTLLSESNGEK